MPRTKSPAFWDVLYRKTGLHNRSLLKEYSLAQSALICYWSSHLATCKRCSGYQGRACRSRTYLLWRNQRQRLRPPHVHTGDLHIVRHRNRGQTIPLTGDADHQLPTLHNIWLSTNKVVHSVTSGSGYRGVVSTAITAGECWVTW